MDIIGLKVKVSNQYKLSHITNGYTGKIVNFITFPPRKSGNKIGGFGFVISVKFSELNTVFQFYDNDINLLEIL